MCGQSIVKDWLRNKGSFTWHGYTTCPSLGNENSTVTSLNEVSKNKRERELGIKARKELHLLLKKI